MIAGYQILEAPICSPTETCIITPFIILSTNGVVMPNIGGLDTFIINCMGEAWTRPSSHPNAGRGRQEDSAGLTSGRKQGPTDHPMDCREHDSFVL